MNRSMIVTGLVLAAVATGPSGAGATTFEGSCQAVGEGGFSSGAGLLPAQNDWWLEADGGCSGLLDGRQIGNLPVRVRIRFTDDPLTGCVGSLTTGSGTLIFRPGSRSRKTLRFDEVQAGPGAVIIGRQGGKALGYLTAYTQLARQYPDASGQCAAGTLQKFVAEWAMKTLTLYSDERPSASVSSVREPMSSFSMHC